MNIEELLQKIKSRGYWMVEIRPTKFDKLRIPTLSKAQEVVQSCIVTLRGWDYPHWNSNNVQNMEDWVEAWEDWGEYIEYWRFYRSGKFIHVFALHEDHIDMEKALPIRLPQRPKREGYFGFISGTFRVTEVFEFAARLANKNVLNPKAFISIGLHNIKDHQLTAFDASRLLRDDYVYTTDDPIVIEKEIPEQDLIAKPDAFALDYIVEIFERFQWNNPPRQVLSEAQKKLRSFRLK